MPQKNKKRTKLYIFGCIVLVGLYLIDNSGPIKFGLLDGKYPAVISKRYKTGHNEGTPIDVILDDMQRSGAACQLDDPKNYERFDSYYYHSTKDKSIMFYYCKYSTGLFSFKPLRHYSSTFVVYKDNKRLEAEYSGLIVGIY